MYDNLEGVKTKTKKPFMHTAHRLNVIVADVMCKYVEVFLVFILEVILFWIYKSYCHIIIIYYFFFL